MKTTIVKALLLAHSALFGVSVGHAADLGPVDGRSRRVVVVVDDLFVRAGHCRRNPNCIAPRVLPLVGDVLARREALTALSVPVDPRFAYPPQ